MIKVDRKIYNDAVISKVCYWLAKDYIVHRALDGDIESLRIERKDAQPIDEHQLLCSVNDMLNDYKLRQIIENETHDIRTILYAKAFADSDDVEED